MSSIRRVSARLNRKRWQNVNELAKEIQRLLASREFSRTIIQQLVTEINNETTIVFPSSRDFNYFKQVGSTLESYYAAGELNAGNAGTMTTTAERLYAVPLHVPRGGTLDSIGIGVATLGNGNVRLGVYESISETDIRPGNLLVDTGSVAVTSTGLKSASVNVVLTTGQLYHLAFATDNNATQAVVDTFANLEGWAAYGYESTDPGSSYSGGRYVMVTHATGALPVTFPTVTWTEIIKTEAPKIFYHLAS
jgi:hypothetical protein